MAAPTQDQIAHTKTNLDNMRDWVDDFHSYGKDTIAEVYSKLSETDDNDAGQTIITNLLDTAFWSIGSLEFPGAGVISSFLGTFFGAYAGAGMPDSLKQKFDGIYDRFAQTCELAKTDLVTIHDDVKKYWEQKYTNPVTGKEGYVYQLGDGEVNMPAKDDKNNETLYNTMYLNALAALKLSLTKMTIGTTWFIIDDSRGTFHAGTEADLISWIHKFMPDAQDRMFTYNPDTGGSCCPIAGFHLYENVITSSRFSSAPLDLCQWLFIDDGFGNTLNKDALAMRKDVFLNWGLQHNWSSSNPVKAEPRETSPGNSEDERSKGDKWRAFVTSNSRSAMEKQLIKKAQQDFGFLRNLVKEPKKTIEEFFGLPVPAAVDIEVLQEMPGNFKLVIPLAGALAPDPVFAERVLESQSL